MGDTAELVERAQNGDNGAFAVLYDRHARLIRAICYDATAHLSSAEDLSQDVFLKAYQKLPQLRDGDRFLPWLCEIARRAGRDWQRRSRRNGPLASGVVDVAAPHEESCLADLREAIRQLPDKERMALHLFYLDEQPVVVARQVLGLSQSGFYKLLDRARERVGLILRRSRESNE
jgi:RNA polymerase sigma-70 factor (ECF subfamily)